MENLSNKEKFRKAVVNGKFTMDEELYFLDVLLSKYNFISAREYADRQGISPQGVKSRLKAVNDPYIYLADKLLILN